LSVYVDASAYSSLTFCC